MSTTLDAAPPSSTTSSQTTLTRQLGPDDGETTPRSSRTTNVRSPKPRSFSDAPKPVLSPSPAFREPVRRISKDDTAIQSPSTPRRPTYHVRGLSLTMPAREPVDNGIDNGLSKTPLSPKLDSSHIYGSPASMLPRRSRGMDYTRACTSLHHSTLAESSPDQSPITGRGMQIPQRRSLGSTVLDSPSNMSSSMWSTMPERTHMSSSVSSVNMLESDSDSDSSSDEEMVIDREADDPMLSTPAVTRLNGGLMGGMLNSPGVEWMNTQQASPAQATLSSFHPNMMSFRRARMRKRRSQHSSSSVSMNSSKPSPAPMSPSIIKSVETSGYFGGPGMTRHQLQSRRESLSLGTDHLHLSDSEENKTNGGQSLSDMENSHPEGPRGVVRRAVTRRGNLLPKTKGFARIRAALLEESQPVDAEVRREAEVIRQVHENDPNISAIKSPTFHSTNSISVDALEASIEGNSSFEMPLDSKSLRSDSFSRQVEKNSAGLGFWNGFDARFRTPPPTFLPRESSSAISDEMMDTPDSSQAPTADNPSLKHLHRSRSRSTTPVAPTAGDVARRVNNKRRRDDDFDPAFTKRRAVSPGMSVQNSPVLPQSPVLNSDKSWGKPPPKSNGHGDRSNSGGSISSMKKIGLQGMNETSEGMMSMSID